MMPGYLPKEMPAATYLPVAKRKRAGRAVTSRARFPESPSMTLPVLSGYYRALSNAHGPQHWWPARTRFEVIVGAILTQNTSWSNVERALAGMRREKLLNPAALARVKEARLAQLIRSSGYFRQKARKLKAFVHFLNHAHGGSLTRMLRTPTDILRAQLLDVHGIGPETADSILLYAGNRAVFVVDAYTRRILERHHLASGQESYEQIRQMFEHSLPPSASLFNEYHALLVRTGKHFCRTRAPLCDSCALKPFLTAPAENPR
jgi:endonuclease III related protein